MSIIEDHRDELEYEMFVQLMKLISSNLEVESQFLTASPQTLFSIEVGEMIEKCADIFGYKYETAEKIFNNIMNKKANKLCKEQ